MKKEKRYAFGKNIYLLGQDERGINYWLEEASWDCDWYYGFGYIETYTNNKNPEKSKDIVSHEHYNSKILESNILPDDFRKIFKNTPLNDNEIWELNELMKTFYTIQNYMALLYNGSSHITNNPSKNIIKNKTEWLRLKNEVLPDLFNKIYDILTIESEAK